MNFMIEWQEKYIVLPLKFVSSSQSVMFFHYIDMPMTAFLTIFRGFSKIFENCSEGQKPVPIFQKVMPNNRLLLGQQHVVFTLSVIWLPMHGTNYRTLLGN